MQLNRQLLATLVKRFTANAIEQGDVKYGRQLATMLEMSALQLRAKLGGTPRWEPAPRAKAPNPNGRPISAPPGPAKAIQRPPSYVPQASIPEQVAALTHVAQAPKIAYASDGLQTMGLCPGDIDHFVRTVIAARGTDGTLLLPDGRRIVAWPEGHALYAASVDNLLKHS